MKKLNKLFLALAGISAVSAGLAVGFVGMVQNSVKPAMATDSKSTGIYLLGDFNAWTKDDSSKMYFVTGSSNPFTYYLEVTMTSGQGFKVYDSEHFSGNACYVSYISTAVSDTGDFTGGGENANVVCSLGGTYRVTYSYTSGTDKNISEVAFTAEGYANYFLSATATECAATALSPSTWTVANTQYIKATTSDAKISLKATDALDVGTPIEKFAARYDYVMKKYAYENFVNRTISSGAAIVSTGNSDSSSTLVLGGIAAISVLAAGGYFFVRKKRPTNSIL